MTELREHLAGFERHARILQALSPNSVALYRRSIEGFFAWLASVGLPIDPAAVTRRDIEAYMEHLFYRGNANVTRNGRLIALRKFFRYLVYAGAVSEDVTAFVPRPKLKRRFVPHFQKEEIVRIFAAIDITTEKGLRDAVAIILGVFCGLRAGEIIGLEIEDIIEVGRTLDIHVVGKGDKERTVYLWKAPSDMVRTWLLRRISQGARPTDPLIVSYKKGLRLGGRPMAIGTMDDILKHYAARAGIRKARVYMHMLRASHASALRHVQGYDTPAIAERLGHASIMTTDRYIATRGRIHKTYPSLAAYWREFTTIWTRSDDGDAGQGAGDGGQGAGVDKGRGQKEATAGSGTDRYLSPPDPSSARHDKDQGADSKASPGSRLDLASNGRDKVQDSDPGDADHGGSPHAQG